MAVQRIVILPVVKFLLDPTAYFDLVFGSDSQVPPIQQSMEITSQKYTIICLVQPTFGVGANMGGLKYWKNTRSACGAASIINIRH